MLTFKIQKTGKQGDVDALLRSVRAQVQAAVTSLEDEQERLTREHGIPAQTNEIRDSAKASKLTRPRRES